MCAVQRTFVFCVVRIIRAVADIAVAALVDSAVGLAQPVDDVILVHNISERKTVLRVDDAVCRCAVCLCDVSHDSLRLKRCSIDVFADHVISSFDLMNRNSSARAIRKTALRAYCGCCRCFAHILALSSSVYQEPDFYASINPSSDNQMSELLVYIVL